MDTPHAESTKKHTVFTEPVHNADMLFLFGNVWMLQGKIIFPVFGMRVWVAFCPLTAKGCLC